MNCLIGISNGALENHVIDDPLVTKIHIGMQIENNVYIYWFSLKNNSTDYPSLKAFHYGYSHLYYTSGRVKKNVGYSTMEIKRAEINKEQVVSIVLTFWNRTNLDKFIGSVTINTDTHARRIMMRFFPNCDVQEVIYDPAIKQWKGNLLTVGELFVNDKTFVNQIFSIGQQISTIKNDVYANRNVLDKVQNDMRAMNTILITTVNELKEAQASLSSAQAKM